MNITSLTVMSDESLGTTLHANVEDALDSLISWVQGDMSDMGLDRDTVLLYCENSGIFVEIFNHTPETDPILA